MEIPDELYRRVKAKSALQGRPIREVAVDLFRDYVATSESAASALHSSSQPDSRRQVDGEPVPRWFGALGTSASRTQRHDMEAIRESIAHGEAAQGRLARLERQGIIRRAPQPQSADLFAQPRPKARKGASIVAALLDERRAGR